MMCREMYKVNKHIEIFCKFLLQTQEISSLWSATNDAFAAEVCILNCITDVS
jgi:hypothetical protein